MTKIIMNPDLLDYREEMAELVKRTARQKPNELEPYLSRRRLILFDPDILPPPKIHDIELSLYTGQPESTIFLIVSAELEMARLQIAILDEQGHLIESGDAALFDEERGFWDYLATVEVAPGTAVEVRAVAIDRLWGTEVRSVRTTIR